MTRAAIIFACIGPLLLSGCGPVDAGEAVDKLESTLMQLHLQESVRPHEGPQPDPPPGSVAVEAESPLPTLDLAHLLLNPLTSDPDVIESGRLAYRRYCWQCHGQKMDGQSATVGPSLPPGKLDLLDTEVLSQSDGELFWKTSEGFDNHPPLNATMTRQEIWESIVFIRAVAAGRTESFEPANFRWGSRPLEEDMLFRDPTP